MAQEYQDRRSGPATPGFEADRAGPRPPWLKVRHSVSPELDALASLVVSSGLHTVCQSAACPNLGECWSRRALTFMILGNVCTRSCGFCDVSTGRPSAVDLSEPSRVAAALETLRLRYAVITSVDRDDLPDGGAGVWAETIRALRASCPSMGIEVLTPDFGGVLKDVHTVVDAGPDVFAHNVETIPRLHGSVRPQANYRRSLDVLQAASERGAITKSGLMVGLGEEEDEVVETLEDLRDAGCSVVSIGQYLRPSRRHLPVDRWVSPDEFERYAREGRRLGLAHVEAGPLVRSSYRADQQAVAARQHRTDRC